MRLPPAAFGNNRMNRQDIQEIAWRDFITYAWQEPAMRKTFEEVTGLKLLTPAISPLERLIDQATKALEETLSRYVTVFVAWVTVWHWGLEQAPESYRKEFAELRKKGLAFQEPKG